MIFKNNRAKSLVALSCTALTAFGVSAFQGRIAITCDGNQHDEDDYGATPMALAIIAKAGLQDKLVHYDYNSHIGTRKGESIASRVEEMTESALGAQSRFKLKRSVFFDDSKELQKSINNIKKIVNESSAANPLYFVLGGPSEVMYRGLKAADPDKRKFVTVVSHSWWNEGHGPVDKSHPELSHSHTQLNHNIEDVKKLGVKFKRINEQNKYFNTQRDWSRIDWMRNHKDPNVRWVYSRIQVTGRPDFSDAGMTWYVVKGNDTGTAEKLKAFIGTGIPVKDSMARVPATAYKLNAATDFTNRAIAGFAPARVDTVRGALAVDATLYKNKFAAANTIFKGESGTYNFRITTLTELDGESEYRLFINGAKKGYFKNQWTKTDYAPIAHTWRNIAIKKGDTIRVDFNAKTNGKIPEGSSTAYSRGRWKSLELYKGVKFQPVSTGGTITPPDNGTDTKPTGNVTFEEKNGVVIIEAENTKLNSSWVEKSSLANHTGTGYLESTHPNSYGKVPENSILTYNIKVNKPGKYRINMHTRNGVGVLANDAGNDSWVHVDSAKFFSEYTREKDEVVQTPNPLVVDHNLKNNGFIKYFVQSRTGWKWGGATSRHAQIYVPKGTKGAKEVKVNGVTKYVKHSEKGGGRLFAQFSKAGVYKLQLASRSKGHLIDRIVLYKEGVKAPFDNSLPETIADDKPVTIAVSSVTIDSIPPVFQKIGPTNPLKTTVLPANATNKTLTWSSSNPSVATVNSDGRVQSVANGTTIITAKSTNGKTATITVKVATSGDNQNDPVLEFVSKTIVLKALGNGKYVRADKTISETQPPLVANITEPGWWTEFTVVDAGNGYVGLKARATDLFVTVDTNNLLATALKVDENSQFKFTKNDDGSYLIYSKGGKKFISAAMSVDETNWPLVPFTTEVTGTWGKYEVEIKK